MSNHTFSTHWISSLRLGYDDPITTNEQALLDALRTVETVLDETEEKLDTEVKAHRVTAKQLADSMAVEGCTAKKLDDVLAMLKRVLEEGISVGGLLDPIGFSDDLEEEARSLIDRIERKP